MEWISVEDRLPETKFNGVAEISEQVLIIRDTGYIMISSFWRGDLGGVWTTGTYPEKGVVTHWMPLPDPPQDALEDETNEYEALLAELAELYGENESDVIRRLIAERYVKEIEMKQKYEVVTDKWGEFDESLSLRDLQGMVSDLRRLGPDWESITISEPDYDGNIRDETGEVIARRI